MFIAHGEFRLEKKDQIIFIESKGPFNHEAVELYTQQMNQMMNSFIGDWGQVVTLHQDSLFTPQAEQSMKAALYERKSKGLKASAVIIHDEQARFIIEHQISRVYDEVGINYTYVSSPDEATSWVNQHLS